MKNSNFESVRWWHRQVLGCWDEVNCWWHCLIAELTLEFDQDLDKNRKKNKFYFWKFLILDFLRLKIRFLLISYKFSTQKELMETRSVYSKFCCIKTHWAIEPKLSHNWAKKFKTDLKITFNFKFKLKFKINFHNQIKSKTHFYFFKFLLNFQQIFSSKVSIFESKTIQTFSISQ